ncbi:AdoMet_MTases domain containing protein [Burkholderiales bacterium]
MYRKILIFLRRLVVLIRSGTSAAHIVLILGLSLRHTYLRSFSSRYQQTVKRTEEFVEESLLAGVFTQDWFSSNIPQLLYSIEPLRRRHLTSGKILEIGSFEGLSTLFFLKFFEGATVYCVDTWTGGDEHSISLFAGDMSNLDAFSRFRLNIASYADRVRILQGRSASILDRLTFEREKFDIVYVDGSHYSTDVLVDSILSFDLLKVGGYLVFDDLFWGYYSQADANPLCGIVAFLRARRRYLKVISCGYQLVLMKDNEVSRATGCN